MPYFPEPPPLPPLVSINHAYHVPMDPTIHLRSGWKDPIGKKLTNGIIRNRTKQGFYGEEAKLIALKKVEAKTGFVERCACGQKIGVKYLSFKYLPTGGFYCDSCRLMHREANAKAVEQDKEFKARITKISIEDFV